MSLDGVDPADAGAHAEILEKVMRKLRSGQMPPIGRPRADEAARPRVLAHAVDRALRVQSKEFLPDELHAGFDAVVAANGQLVDVCEACHKAFKPALPSEGIVHKHTH